MCRICEATFKDKITVISNDDGQYVYSHLVTLRFDLKRLFLFTEKENCK